MAITAVGTKTLVAVGYNGTIVTSHDSGNTWKVKPSHTKQWLHAITAVGTKTLVAVGWEGTIVTSHDLGNTWKVQTSHTKQLLNAITAVGTKTLVAVGNKGTINTMPLLHIPSLYKITRFERLDNAVTLVMELNDKDDVCKNICDLNLYMRNDIKGKPGGEHLPLVATRVKPSHSLKPQWRVSFSPNNYKILPGEKYYLTVEIKHKMFTYRYTPSNGKYFSTIYQYDPTVMIGIIIFLTLFVMFFAMYFIKPLWILHCSRINTRLKVLDGIKMKMDWATDIFIIIGIPFRFYAKRPRVLEAWLAKYNDRLRENFENTPAVLSLETYFAMPIHNLTDNEEWKKPTEDGVKELIHSGIRTIELTGGGGSGKSTFAAQIGNWALKGKLSTHPMMPVWLDADPDNIETWLIDHIRRVTQDETLPSQFIESLFSHRRMFLIADRVSEHSEKIENALRQKRHYLKLLVVTSRRPIKKLELSLSDIVQLETIALDGFYVDKYFLHFIERHYHVLGSHNSKHKQPGRFLETPEDRAELLTKFSKLIKPKNTKSAHDSSVNFTVTPLLATLYLDQVLKEGSFDSAPSTIIDLYLDYIKRVNPSTPGTPNYIPYSDLIESVQFIAKAELGDNYPPVTRYLSPPLKHKSIRATTMSYPVEFREMIIKKSLSAEMTQQQLVDEYGRI